MNRCTRSERDALKALFSKEKAVLEAKYEKLHGSLYSNVKRLTQLVS